jgi:uncharacterized protein
MTYRCTKCDHTTFSTAEVSTTGGAMSRMFDFSAHVFQAVVCDNCGYTELYKDGSDGWKDLLDGLGAG